MNTSKLISLVFFLQAIVVAKPINVVTTTSDLGAIVREIGGDFVKVTVLASPNADPHYIDPKPSYIITLKKSAMLIAGGKGLEDSWLPPLILKSRNKKINKNGSGYVDASIGVSLLEVPDGKVDRSHGDTHPYGNPHFMTSPKNALVFGTWIAKKIIEINPETKIQVEQNLNSYKERLESLNQLYAEKYSGINVITFHKSYEYIADFLGLKIVGYLEPKPGIPPTASHLKELIPIIKNKKVEIVLLEPYQRKNSAKFLKEKTNIHYQYLRIFPDSKSKTFSMFLTGLYAEIDKLISKE